MGKSASPSFKQPAVPAGRQAVADQHAAAPDMRIDEGDLDQAEPSGEPEQEWVQQPWLPPLLAPKVAIATGLLAAFAGAGVAFAGGAPGPIVLGLQIALAALLVVLTATDLLVQRLPDVLVMPAYLAAAAAMVAAALAGEITWHQAMVATACAAGAWVLYYAIAFFTGGMGFGDVKLAGLIGLVLGLQGIGNAVAGFFLFPCLASVPILIVVLLLNRGLARKSGLPFGPMLAAGAILALLLHQNVSDTYTVLSWKF